MRFNRQKFNSGAFFNRNAPSVPVSFAGTANMVFSVTTGAIHANARYGNATLTLQFGGDGELSADLSFIASADLVFDSDVRFSADAYCTGEGGIVFDAIASAVRVADDKQIALEGLEFKPNDVIIIDTETLDVFFNGVPDVSSWVVGSDFFQLGKGMNTLTFYDDATSRELTVTVIWADRWL